MKRTVISLDEIKKRITELKGSPVIMEVNRGRNKIFKFECKIISVYPSVFTVETLAEKPLSNKTYSYFDVLCGDVKIIDG